MVGVLLAGLVLCPGAVPWWLLRAGLVVVGLVGVGVSTYSYLVGRA